MDAVRTKQMSAVDHSVGPQKEQQMYMLSKHTLTDLLQLYCHGTSRFICAECSLQHHNGPTAAILSRNQQVYLC